MVNGRLTEKPAVLLSAPLRWRIAVGSLFGFRSGVLPGGIMRPDVSPLFGRRYGGLGNGGGGDLVKAIVKKGLQLFPERQLLLRSEGRVRYITLSRWLQMSVAAGGMAGIALLSYAAISLSGERRGADQPVEISEGAERSTDLQAQIEQLQHRLAAANSQLSQIGATAAVSDAAAADSSRAEASIKLLEEARDRATAEREELQRQLAAAREAASDKSAHLGQLTKALEANRGELRQSDAQRTALQNRVHQLEADLEGANARTSQYKTNLESIERKLQQLAAEHDKTLAERDRLQAQIAELQSKLTSREIKLPPAVDIGSAPNNPFAPPRTVADRPTEQRSDNGGDLERLIASTGIDVEKLLGRLTSVPSGQGGPYMSLDKIKHGAQPDPQRSAELQKILKTLPLASPLAQYQVESGFGGRPDPFMKKQAFHSGLDLSAPYRTPVYSTAPGVVIFAGVKEGYGKVVDIDHGHGIVTRYAHLHRIVVANGQKVASHHQVGELGSTGRSTGPHLHYEVVVNGTAQDPEKFMQAGKNVVQTAGGK